MNMTRQQRKDKIFQLYINGYTTKQIIEWFQLNKNITLTKNHVLKHMPAKLKKHYV